MANSQPTRFFSAEEIDVALRNAFFTSVSLTIAAFVCGHTPGALSLLDGIIVTYLPFSITVGAVTNPRLLSQQAGQMVKFAHFLHISFSAAFGIMLWALVDTYGTTPGCNPNSSVKFVVAGRTVVATNKGLRVGGLFLFTFIGIMAVVTPNSWKRSEREVDDPETQRLQMSKDIIILGWMWTVFVVGIWVYDVWTIEQIIRRNEIDHGLNQWTYGQILALTLLLSPMWETASIIGKKLEFW
jgi:hypothetical protein